LIANIELKDGSKGFMIVTGGDITPDEAQIVDFLFTKYGEDPPFGQEAVTDSKRAPKPLIKCPNCGGTLSSFIPKSDIRAKQSFPREAKLDSPNRALFKCSNCGAGVVLDKEEGHWE